MRKNHIDLDKKKIMLQKKQCFVKYSNDKEIITVCSKKKTLKTKTKKRPQMR